MQFGVFVPQGWRLDLTTIPAGRPQYEAMLDVALRAERLGYDSIWLFDHFHTIPEAKLEPTFECWMSTAALAQATSRIRIGQMVTCNFYRSPALLAKMASTVDVISNGRLDFGIGAGWYEHEAVAYGYGFERPAERIGRLEEALQIIRGMWTQDRFQFRGKYYTAGVGPAHDYFGREVEMDGAINHPKPLQRPHPPLWVAGGGEKLTLRSVARHADYANFFAPSPELAQRKNRILDEHCEAVGRDPRAIRRTIGVELEFGTQAQAEARQMAVGHSREHVRQRWMWGSPQEVVDKLAAFGTQAGIDYVIVFLQDSATGDSLERFASEVMPALRGVAVQAAG